MRLFWLLALALLCTAHVAKAQVVVSGQWRSGATAIDAQVESWGSDCGPPPTSSQSTGGSVVRVVQVGDQLQLHTGGRIIKSDVCFGQNPGLRRSSKTVKDNTWVTRCETPMDDPRAETGVYTLKLLSPDRLLYQDVSRFRWQLKASLCVATITTVQTLTRLTDAEAAQAAKPAPPAPSPVVTATPTAEKGAKAPPAPPAPPKLPDLPTTPVATAPAPEKPPVRTDLNMAPTLPASSAQNSAKPAPCVPGPAARLALAPRRRTIELGSKLCFRTRVVDKSGCALPQVAPTWSLDHGPALRAKLDPRGCFEASAQAADGEGTFHVTATVATAQGSTLRAEAVLDVVAADLSGLVAKRLFEDEDEGLEAELAADVSSGTTADAAPAAPVATSATATRAVGATEAPTSRPPWMWPAIGAVLALLGGAIALVARRRTRDSVVPEPTPAMDDLAMSQTIIATPPKAAAPTELRCPKCGAVYPLGSAFCGTDGTPLKA